MKQKVLSNTYTKPERAMYLTGLLGQNIIYNVIATGMAYYFQSVIFLPAMAISIIMAAARIWDAINDPMMGTIVDKTRTKWGKCRPYLFFVPPVVLVTTILTFVNKQYSAANPGWMNALIIAWAGISYILWGMTYTAGDIPIWGITSLMTENEKDRSSILGLARICGGVGGGIVMLTVISVSQSLGNSFKDRFGLSTNDAMQWGFLVFCSALTVVGCLLFECAAFTKERVKQPSEEKKSFKDNIRIMWNCVPFRRVLIAGVIRSPMNILSIVAMTLLSYYYGDINGNGQDYMKYMIILGGAMFLGMFGAMAAIPPLCERIEKRTVHNACCLLATIPFVGMFVLYLIDGTNLMATHWLAILAVLFLVGGGAIGASQVIQSIMIADCVDYDEYRTGYRPDGVFFSGQSFIVKLGAGISSIIQGIVFAAVGFSGDAVNAVNNAISASPADDFMFATAPQFASYRFGMFFLVSIPPAIGFALSVIPMLKYEISNGEHSHILALLNAKRNGTAAESAQP